MKKILGLIVFGVLAFFIWFVFNSSKPECKAKVGITREQVSIKNCGAVPWSNPEITINSAFDGPIMIVRGSWGAGETRILNLREFSGKLNHQAFNPESDRATKVIIAAPGFQLGIFHN